MVQPLLLLLISLVIAFALVVPLGKALKRYPVAFYVVAALVVAAFLACRSFNMGGPAFRWIAPIVQKGYLATVLLGVVMFTGVFDEESAIRRRLQPIRGELSVISSILYVGHLATYATSFLPRLGMTMQFQPLLGTAVLVAIPMTCVFILLAVTSFRTVKTRMPPRVWQGLQRLSYVMVALLAAHVAFALGRSAMDGSAVAQASLATYLIVIAVYAVLRVRKALVSRQRGTKEQLAA